MNLNFTKISAFLIPFITFIGFYAIIVIVLFFGVEQSRFFTIPLRLFATLLIFIVFFIKGYRVSTNHFVYICFFGFFIIYFISVYSKVVLGSAHLNQPSYEIVLYSLVYAIFPFLYFSARKEESIYRIFYKAIIISGVVLSVSCIFLYSDILLSGYSRISLAQYDVFYRIISPLLLSYSGALIIGISLSKMLFDNVTAKETMYLGFAFLLGLVPFFLGASRGSVIALILPFFFIFMSKLSRKIKIKTFLIVFFFLLIVIYLANYFGTGVFLRLLRILEDIQHGSSSVSRIEIWSNSLYQFLSAPLFGSSIGMEMKGHSYPHNIFLEVLMSTGLIGFLPFGLLVIYGIHKSFLIVKYRTEYIWIFILFWQGLILHSFSGTLYNAVFFWGGLGLVASVNLWERDQRNRTAK